MIQFPVPHKARFSPCVRNFSAPFAGTYDFGIAANAGLSLLPLQANIVYLISSYSVGGNIASEDYLSAINTLPKFILTRKNDNQPIRTDSIPVVQFESGKETMIFADSKQANDELLINLSGILNQTPSLVGVDPVILTISFSIFAIEDRDYAIAFQEKLSGNTARSL
jgi:hypothetical protein